MTDVVKKFMREFLKIEGAEIYLVGGAVRDILMDRPVNDFDFTTNLSPEVIEKHFKTVDIGQSKDFGIVSVQFEGESFEVAQYRSDVSYSNGRQPDAVKFDVSLKEDLARRDFTINAMAMDIDGKIIDPFGGQNDLKSKFIRAVGKADERIKEDALRILRAIRFASVFDFGMGKELLLAIMDNMESINKLSQERITAEIIKVASKGGKAFFNFFSYIDALSLMPIVFPEIEVMRDYKQYWEHHPEGALMESLKTGEIEPLIVDAVKAGTHKVFQLGSVFDHVKAVLKEVPEDVDEFVVLSALYHDIGKPITAELKDEEIGSSGFKGHEHEGVKVFEEIAKKRKIGGELRDVISFVISRHMDANNQRLVKKSKILELGLHEFFPILMEVARADDKSRNTNGNILYDEERFNANMQKFIDAKESYIDDKLLKKKISEFVDGNKIMQMLDLKPSRKVGEILDEVKEFIIERDFDVTTDEVDRKILSLK